MRLVANNQTPEVNPTILTTMHFRLWRHVIAAAITAVFCIGGQLNAQEEIFIIKLNYVTFADQTEDLNLIETVIHLVKGNLEKTRFFLSKFLIQIVLLTIMRLM